MLLLNTNESYQLNEASTMVLEGLLAGEQVSDLGTSLRQHFEISDDQAEQDVASLIDQLIASAIVTAQKPLNSPEPDQALKTNHCAQA